MIQNLLHVLESDWLILCKYYNKYNYLSYTVTVYIGACTAFLWYYVIVVFEWKFWRILSHSSWYKGRTSAAMGLEYSIDCDTRGNSGQSDLQNVGFKRWKSNFVGFASYVLRIRTAMPGVNFMWLTCFKGIFVVYYRNVEHWKL